jgi:hypothetical protein
MDRTALTAIVAQENERLQQAAAGQALNLIRNIAQCQVAIKQQESNIVEYRKQIAALTVAEYTVDMALGAVV